MQFIVKSNQRWNNGYFYKIFTFDELCQQFHNDGNIENELDGTNELDVMMGQVFNLTINNSYTHSFFTDEKYTFKRVA